MDWIAVVEVYRMQLARLAVRGPRYDHDVYRDQVRARGIVPVTYGSSPAP